MWYQMTQEDTYRVIGALRRYRDELQWELDKGFPARDQREWLTREIVAIDKLVTRCYDEGKKLSDVLGRNTLFY